MTAPILTRLDAALEAAGRSRESFEIIITPLQETPEEIESFANLGVDRLVLHMGSQRQERLEPRLLEMERISREVA